MHNIASNTINEELHNLYSSLMPEVANCILACNDKMCDYFICNPYLLAASDDYFNSELRIMIFGQVTNCWYGEKNNGIYSERTSVKELMSLYDLFSNNPDRDCHSPFWNLVNKLDTTAKSLGIRIITNNLAKVGYTAKPGYDPVVNALFDNAVKQEIIICNPDLILMTTGPRYDNLIKQRFGNYDMKPWIKNISVRKCAELIFSADSVLAHRTVIRTYHPGYLTRVINKYTWPRQIINYLIEYIKTLTLPRQND